MKTLVADQRLVTELLPMDEAIAVMRDTLTLLAGGDVFMPLRSPLGIPAAMPPRLDAVGAPAILTSHAPVCLVP